MLQPLEDFGHSNPEQCLELLRAYVRIKDPDVREGVLALMEDLAAETGELFRLTPEGPTPFA